MIKTAFVNIWGERVGAVAWDENRGVASFEFESRFKENNWELAPIKMPLNSRNRTFEFPELKTSGTSQLDAFKGLPGMLADTLPDKYGNQLINAWLAKEGRPENSMNPVEQLCFIGSRGMGALEFEPSQLTEGKRPFEIEIKSLVEIADRILNKRKQFETSLNAQSEKAMLEILKIGTSAGGARPKAIIAPPTTEKTGRLPVFAGTYVR